MQIFYELTSQQKNYFLREVFRLAARLSFVPTLIEVLEETDEKFYVVVFLNEDVGGVHYIIDVIEKNVVGFDTYTKEQASFAIASSNLNKALGKNQILPQNKFMEIKRIIDNR